MTVSVFDLFSVGIGPSSSRTVGPMRAALRFVESLNLAGTLEQVTAVKVELYGSLAMTGKAHGTHSAVLMGLEGEHPETVDVESIPARIELIEEQRELRLLGRRPVPFDPRADIEQRRGERRPEYSNALTLTARDASGAVLGTDTYFSIGGGFILNEAELAQEPPPPPKLPYSFESARVARRRQPLRLTRRRDPHDVRHRPRHERPLQGDLARRAGGERGRVLTGGQPASTVWPSRPT